MLHTLPHLRRLALVFTCALMSVQISTYAQTVNETTVSTGSHAAANLNDDCKFAYRAIAELEQLKASIFVCRSYDEFEDDGRLARVSLDTFNDKLNRVTAEVESILPRISDTKLRTHLSNSLHSYRDGAYRWANLGQQKVVSLERLRTEFKTTTPTERFFTSSIPHTVVIHWRQASRYLQRAQRLLGDRSKTHLLTESFISSDGSLMGAVR